VYGHISRNCPLLMTNNTGSVAHSSRELMPGSERKQIQCFYCREFGHVVSECSHRRGSVSSVSGYSDHSGNSDRETSSFTSQALTLSQPVHKSVAVGVQQSQIPPMVLSDFLTSVPVQAVDSLNTIQQFRESWPATSASMTTRDSVELYSSMQIQAKSLHFGNAGSLSYPPFDVSKPPPLQFGVPSVPFPLQSLPPNVDVNVRAVQSEQHYLQNVHTALELYQQSPPPMPSVMPDVQTMSSLLMHTADMSINQQSSLLCRSSDIEAHNSDSYDGLSNLVRRPVSASLANAMSSSVLNNYPYHCNFLQCSENGGAPSYAVQEQHRQMSTTQPSMVSSSYTQPSLFTGGLNVSRPPPFDPMDIRPLSFPNLAVGNLVPSSELAETNMTMQNIRFPMLNPYGEMPFTQEQLPPGILGNDFQGNFEECRQAMLSSCQSQIDEKLYGRGQFINCMSNDLSGNALLNSIENPTLNMISTFSNGRRIRSREEDRLREVEQIPYNETLHYDNVRFQDQTFSNPDIILPFNVESLLHSCNSEKNIIPNQYMGELNPTSEMLKCERQPVGFQECDRQSVSFQEFERQPVSFQECERQCVVLNGQKIDNCSQLNFDNPEVYDNQECPAMSVVNSVLNVEVDMTRYVSDEADKYGVLAAPSRAITAVSGDGDHTYYVNSPCSSDVYLPPSPEDKEDIYSFSVESSTVAIELESNRPNNEEAMNLETMSQLSSERALSNEMRESIDPFHSEHQANLQNTHFIDNNIHSDSCPTSGSKHVLGCKDVSEKPNSQVHNNLDDSCEKTSTSNVDFHQLQTGVVYNVPIC